MGAGMVHPRVLQGVAIDPEEYTGFAFGLGHRPRGAADVRVPGPAPALRGRRAFPAQFAGQRMKFSLDWLDDFVDVDAAGGADGRAAPARAGGLPVESVEPLRAATRSSTSRSRPTGPTPWGTAASRARSPRWRAWRCATSARGTPSLPAEGEATEQLTSIVIQVPRLCRRFGARARPRHRQRPGRRARARAALARSARSRSRRRSTRRTTCSGTRASRSTPSTSTSSRAGS